MSSPSCPVCSSKMILRTAKRGSNAGSQFWGCSRFPKCRGTVDQHNKGEEKFSDSASTNEDPETSNRKVIWYDNLVRKNYNSEYITLGSAPHFLGELNLNSIGKFCNQFNLLSKKVSIGSPDNDANFIGAILQKLLTRGDLPYCSLGIEESLASQKIIRKLIKEFDKKNPSIGWYWSAEKPFDLKSEISLSLQKCKLTDGDLEKIKKNTKGVFDSPIELKFLTEWIPNNFGLNAIHWFIPQAPLDRLIDAGEDDLGARRVDFLFYHPVAQPIVIELDGEEHLESEDSDARRDGELQSRGITVIRITNDELELGDGPNLNHLKNTILNVLECISTPKSSPIYNILKLSSIASCFQFIFSKALANGTLGLETNSWKIQVSHDFENKEILISAANDFAQMLSALRRLYTRSEEDLKIELLFKKSGPSDLTVGLFLEDSPVSLDHSVRDFDYICCSASIPINVSTDVNTTSVQKTVQALEQKEASNLLTIFLQNLFRKREFRSLQDVSIMNVLKRKDTVTLLPTGAGKSIIYQLAGFLQPGITLVIAPIVALMEDQIFGLSSVGIDKASTAPTGFNNKKKRQEWLRSIEQGGYQFILISPERLQMPDFRDTLRALVESNYINLAVIDEAHCVSEWGHDFRFSYLNLADNLRKFCTSPGGNPPTLLALTGTASRAVLRELLVELNISRDDDEALIRPVSFDRAELRFSISKVSRGGDTSAVLRGILNGLPNKFNQPPGDFYKPSGKETNSGIIFTPFVNGRHGLFAVKRSVQENITVSVTTFSGSAPKETDGTNWEIEKRQNARNFKENNAPILVATKAFGMGIDKPNIRWTLHMGIPPSMEAFYQEAGRAGRDKNLAICNIIFSEVDTEQTDNALSGDGDLTDLRNAAKKMRGNDDVSRALFFHLNAFSGVADEYESVSKVLELIGDLNERKNVELPFDNDTRAELERSLLRLKKCGIIEDLEMNYGSKNIRVSARQFNFEFSRKTIENYIRASQRARLPNIMKKLDDIDKLNVAMQPQSLCNLMIDFTYDVIERSRRRMLYEAVLLGRNCSNDNEIRQYLIDYLQEGLGAEKIAQLAEQSPINFDDWLELFSKISTPIEAGETRGISIRLLETYPDHPGILLLRGVSETLVQKRDDLLVRNSIATSLENSKSRYDCSNQQVSDLIKQLISFASTRSPNLRIPLISTIRSASKNSDYIDDEVTQRLFQESEQWDESSRMIIIASDLEIKLPHIIRLARERFEHHLNYLNGGK